MVLSGGVGSFRGGISFPFQLNYKNGALFPWPLAQARALVSAQSERLSLPGPLEIGARIGIGVSAGGGRPIHNSQMQKLHLPQALL